MGMHHDRWLMAKFVLVILLTGYPPRAWALAQGVRRRPQRARSSASTGMANEVPTVLMIGDRHPGGREAVLSVTGAPQPGKNQDFVTQSLFYFPLQHAI